MRLTVAGGRIAAIETGVEASGERHACAIPGMPNLHSHAFQRAMAGLTEQKTADKDSFWTWREVMYRYLERLTPDDIEAVAALAFMEMLEGGFTRVGEFHYLHHDATGARYADPAEMAGRIVNAAAVSGIGLTLLPVFYAHSGFGGQAPSQGQRRFINDLNSFEDVWHGARRHAARLPDAVMGVAPHSLRAVTPEELAAVSMISDGPVHIHIAEQEREVADCLAWSGARPVEWLLDNAEVDDGWCCVHATHMTAVETTALAGSGAVAGLCPVTEANLGDGIFPAVDFLKAHGRFGVGSDSNVLIDAAQELRLLEYSQRYVHKARNIVEGLYAKALHGGAQALGVTSGIVEGAAADIVSLRADHAALCDKSGDVRLDAHIFAASGSIDCVWRFGRKVVENGRHVGREAIFDAYRQTVERLRA
ncbi:MAG: formimidoylglutamate deiminase [Asticcacaulis sp.]